MNAKTKFWAAALSSTLTVGTLWAADVSNANASPSNASGEQNADEAMPAADNTKVNARDRKKSEPTADQAKNSAADRELMAQIRRAIVNDEELSTYAHNVKIIARDGKVTLKGTVNTQEEKNNIGLKATKAAGSGNVMNDISVKGS